MSKPRLGRAERAIVRQWHQERKAKKEAIIRDNLSQPVERNYAPRTSSVYSSSPKILVMPYKGLYDPEYSTDTGHREERLPKGVLPRGSVKPRA